jgi:hypothetical protein
MSQILRIDLEPAELRALNTGLAVIAARSARNEKIAAYYDGVARIRDLGIAIPPQLRNIETVVGWPARTVDVRESRIDFERFVSTTGDENPLDVAALWDANGMRLEQSLAHTSALMQGVVFATATAGDTTAGEPEVLYSIHEATNATIGWNPRTRRADWGVAITARKNSGDPKTAILYLPDRIVVIDYVRNAWQITRIPNPIGRPPITMLTRRPRVGRRFGVPVITRAVMSFTDNAVRSLLRGEVADEFFSVPQRYALGADEKAFSATGWEAVIGKMLAISRDEMGDIPTVGQFAQMSTNGQTEKLKALAMMFSGESSIPANYLGIIQDNPSSADAIRVAETALIEDVSRDLSNFEFGWVDLSGLGVMIRDRLTETPAELRTVRLQSRDPATPTRSAQTQNVIGLITAGALPATSRVTYKMLGWDDTTIAELMAEQRRGQVASLVTTLRERRQLPAAPAEVTGADGG